MTGFSHDALRLPVIVAPMFLVSGIDLIVAACEAGMVGALPASNARDADGFEAWLDMITDRLRDRVSAAPFAVNINVQPGRYADPERIIGTCARHRVPLIITSVGDPAEMVARVHDWGGKVFHDVTTVRHAEKAVEAGVDGLILVCAGAGGHAGSASPFSLLPRVRRFFDKTIVLAGGVGDGAGIVAAQALGADLVYMGTRFIASAESTASPDYKAMIVRSDIADILYTPAISGVPANFLRPSLLANGIDPALLRPLAKGARPDFGDGVRAWRDVWSAGHASALVDRISTVKEIADQLAEEIAVAHARR